MRITMAMPAMAASPNGLAAMFTQVTEIEPAPWRISEGRPPPATSRMSSTSGLQLRRDSFITPNLRLIVVRIVKLTVWQMAVARPAPKIPRCSTKINNGASRKFSNAPETSPIMPNADCPWYRSSPLSANDPHTQGAATNNGVRYCTAYGAIVEVDPSMTTSGRRVSNPIVAITKPESTAPAKPTASSREARSLFCLPSSRLIELPAPLPKKKPSACITVMMENAMPMAPDCAVPS